MTEEQFDKLIKSIYELKRDIKSEKIPELGQEFYCQSKDKKIYE